MRNAGTEETTKRSEEAFMNRFALGIAGAVACAVLLAPLAAQSQVSRFDQSQLSALSMLHFVQGCSRRVGPFATQDTAWLRWRQARSQGFSLSNGIFPCYDQRGTRGYCFNVFRAC
jgi:hypothetical protein